METTSVHMSEPREEDEIKKISSTNPNSFLHIFDYTQNTEVKSYSTVESTGEKCNLFLRAPDAETFSRLNHEIDQIERMKQDMEENRKQYFEQRLEEELFKYDLLLKLDDIDGSADRKVRETIKTSQAYQRGRKLGESLKQAAPTTTANNNKEGMAINVLNQNNKAKKSAKIAAEIKEEEGEEGEVDEPPAADESSSGDSELSNSPEEDSIAKTDKKNSLENSVPAVVKPAKKDLFPKDDQKSRSSGSSAPKQGRKAKTPQIDLLADEPPKKPSQGFNFKGFGSRLKKSSSNSHLQDSEGPAPELDKPKRMFGASGSGAPPDTTFFNMQKARSEYFANAAGSKTSS